MSDNIIAEINKMIKEATEKIENSILRYDMAWWRGFRAGLSAVKEVVEKEVSEDGD